MRIALALALLIAGPVAAQEIDERTGLVINPGWEQVRAHCGACHSYALVTSQRADRETWIRMIRWMQESQNLWQFTPEVEAQIFDYLEKSYPPRADRRRAPIAPHLRPPPAKPVQ